MNSLPGLTVSRQLGVVVLILALYVALAYGIYNGLTQYVSGANDFYSRWMGARALFLRGENPYSREVTEEIQMGMFGHLMPPEQDQAAFAYPLYAAFLSAPLVVVPYAEAQALWMAFLVLAVVVGALSLAPVYRVKITPARLGVLVLGTLLFYPTARGVFLGQYALVSFGCLGLVLWAIETRHDSAAGIFLALSTVKPQMVVLLVPLVVLWALHSSRWRIVLATAIGLGALFCLGMVWLPNWLFEFIRALAAYTGYMHVGPPLQSALEMLLPLALVAPMLVIVALILLLLVLLTWLRAGDNFLPAFNLTAIVTTLIAVRIGTPDQVLLLFPLWFWVWSDWRMRHVARALALGLTALALCWLVFFATLSSDTEHPVTTIVLPFFALALYALYSFRPMTLPEIAPPEMSAR